MEFKTSGVCATKINFDVVDNKVSNVIFERGCNGNLKGISTLVDGLDIDTVIKKLEGIDCGSKNTSCPDQLSNALKNYKLQNS